MTALEKINEKLEALNAHKKEVLKDIQKDFPEIVKSIFEQSEKIKSFGWSQYTPYFNDGDECTFSSNVDYPYVNGEDVEDSDENTFLSKGVYDTITEENIQEHKSFNKTDDGYSWYADKKVGETGYFKNPDFDQNAYDTVESFKDTISSIPDELLKDLFGDHCKITIFRDGKIEVEEYSHD
jgi:hypothetical protein